MKCKKCESTNLKIKPNGPHTQLYCDDCGAYQKFLSKEDAELFKEGKL